MRAIFFARVARRIIIRLFFFLSVAAVKEYYKMRGKGSNWRERACLFLMHEEKKFLVEKKKRREILREEDKGDVVKCCFV